MIFLYFVLYFLAAEVLLAVVQFFLYKLKIRLWLRIVLIVVKLVLGLGLGVLVMGGPVQLRVMQPFMLALYVALFMDGVGDIIYTIYRYSKKKEFNYFTFKIISFVCAVLFLTYGMVNMEMVTKKNHTYSSNKIETEHTFAMIADLHVGSAQPFSVTKKTINAVIEENPEFIILDGDIVDDYTTKEEMERTFELFKDCGIPVYWVYGNHDRQGHAKYAGGRKFSVEELENAITSNGIIILKDECIEISSDLVLMGREDMSEKETRKDIKDIVIPNTDAFLLVADHQPDGFKKNCEVGVDLQVSGHTHAGQLFPFRAMYEVIGYSYGDYTYEGSTINVSSGACGWRMPIRTESHCHYDIYHLCPEE